MTALHDEVLCACHGCQAACMFSMPDACTKTEGVRTLSSCWRTEMFVFCELAHTQVQNVHVGARTVPCPRVSEVPISAAAYPERRQPDGVKSWLHAVHVHYNVCVDCFLLGS